MVATLAVLILAVALPMGCAGPAPYDDFVAKLESENIDPSHFVVQVGLKYECEVQQETGFMEKFYGEKKYNLASTNKFESLYLQYNKEERSILSSTILAMHATVDGGTQMKVFCESLGN